MRAVDLGIVICGMIIAMAGSVQAFVSFTRPRLTVASTTGGPKRSQGTRARGADRRSRRVCAIEMHKVTIEHDGESRVLEVDESTSILEAALDNGIELPHDCKLGVCLTCPSKIVSGEIDQSQGTLDDSVVSKGFALTCCSYARSDVVIRSIEEDELVGAQFSDRT